MGSSGLVSATTSEGAMAVGVGSGSGSRRTSGGGEAGGTTCGEDGVGIAALIGSFARARSELVDYMMTSLSSLNRLPEPRSLNTNRVLVPNVIEVLGAAEIYHQ